MKIPIGRYRAFFIVLTGVGLLTIFNFTLGMTALRISAYSFREMFLILPPVFILLGLLDVWVPRETMVKYMGEGSGIKGIVLAFVIGSAAAGPLYGAFPVAAVFMRKGVDFRNVMIFIGAWSTTKIPMILFEAASLGLPFTLTRLLINLPGIVIIAWILSSLMSKEAIQKLYVDAEML